MERPPGERAAQSWRELVERLGDRGRVAVPRRQAVADALQDGGQRVQPNQVPQDLLAEDVVRALPALEHDRVAVEARQRREVLDRAVPAERLDPPANAAGRGRGPGALVSDN